MALNLSDFNNTGRSKEQMRMEAFQPRVKTSPAANPATINTIATLGAALEPNGNLDSAYKAITNQLNYSTSSNALDVIIKQWDQNDIQGSMDSLRTILVDPNVSDQEKQNILYTFQTNQTPEQLGVKVALSAAEADSPGESIEGSELRSMIAAGYDEVDSYHAWAQQQLNALNSDANPGWHDNVKLLAESFVPFLDAADAAMFENLVNVEDAGGAANTIQTLFALGEGKNRLREALDKMPVEQRKPVVQALISTIKSMSGTITTNTSTLRAIRNLEQMISINGYSQTDRWADDFFSVLDATILLSPVRSIAGAVRGGKSAALDAEILRRGAMAEESLTAAGEAPRAPSEPLMIEYKPTAPDYGTDIDNVIDNLSVEATSSEIAQLRDNINQAISQGNGVSIDQIIENSNITDRMNSTQILDLRQSLGSIQIKRKNELDGVMPGVQGDFAEVQRAHISGNVQPTSVSQVYKDVNPSKSRAAHEAVVADSSGRAAELLYGTDRTSALANDLLPDIGGAPRIRHKTEFDEIGVTPDKNIIQHIDDADGAVWASRKEKAVASKVVIDEWKNITGLSPRTAMQTISTIKPEATEVANGVRFNQVYGPKDNGFKDAVVGVEYVKAALRKYGIKDTDLTVLSRQPDGLYGPVKDGQDLRNGDFVVQVQHDYRYDPSEVGFEGFDISPLWKFIPIPDIAAMTREGGVTQQIIPKAVNIDKNAYAAGVSAADKASGLQKQMLQYGKRVADGFKKLSKEQQNLVDQYIRIANDQEIKFNAANIRAAGISEEGLQVLNDWKTVQDTIWVLENRDVNRTLRNRGFQYYVNKATDTQLLVKPIEGRASNVALRDYLLPDGKVGKMSNTELDELYESGGYIAELRKPEDFNGETISHVVVRNTPTEGYARRIRDDDVTLGYRDGYYHVKYTDPYYITAKNKDGTVKTIARAETRSDMEAELSRLRSMNDGVEYDWKYDRSIGMDARFDDELDVQFNSGRSSQRLRGKRLTRVGHDKTLSDAGMESPIDSMVRSIASISNRVAFRDVLEADKRRWLSSFKNLLPNSNNYKFPEAITDIRSGPGANEARHAWRYIQGLQDGYSNLLDDASKMFFNGVANVASNKGWGWVEKVGRKAARANPAGAARLTAFRLFLAANPARQVILQLAPAIPIIASLNPRGFAKVARQAPVLAAWHRGVDPATTLKISKMSGLSVDEMDALIKDYELSGMSAAVNAHSYLSDDLARLADRNVVQRAMSVAGTPLRIAQNIGFDFGEQSLMTSVWISERDRMLRSLGKKSLDATEREELTAKVRALTGDMNRGGDMPYNSNTFSVIMQFMQSPHKIASGLILGHRNLTGAERAKLIAGYTATFGIPTVAIVDQFVDKIIPPENLEQRELIKGGLTNMLLNRFLGSISGEDVNVDFSGSLQPFSTRPITDFIGGVVSSPLTDILSGAAAPSLLSDGGRIRNFIEAVAAPFVPGNYEGVDEYKQIGLTFLQMFTGLSNTMKAMYMIESGKIVTSKGQVVDDDISFMEALMKSAGFQTMDEVNYWASNKLAWESSDQLDNDIKTLVDGLFGLYTRENLSVADLQQYQRVMAEASRVFNGNPAIMNKVADYYKMRIESSPDDLYRSLLKNSGLYDPADIPRIINNSNFTQEQVDTLMEMYRITGEAYGN